MSNDSLKMWLRLYNTYGVGAATFLKLIKHFGAVENVFSQDAKVLTEIVGKGLANSILNFQDFELIERAIAWRDSSPTTRHIVTINDSIYPESLAQIDNPPIIFFAEGNISLLQRNKLAIVGTRHPTNYGIDNALGFAETLVKHNLTIVSGLAAGIDRYAHEGALRCVDGGSTIAVIGTGIDVVYPASNRKLFEQIRKDGLIISEFPLGTPPVNNNFPRRNRIIVGLSKACLVVESAIDGGSMISANFALEMGRDVLTIPGSVHNPMARGCHKLIKMGAKLCETVNDILEELSFDKVEINTTDSASFNVTDDPVLSAMGFEPIDIDNLCQKLNLDFTNLCGKLLELELDEKIISCGGGRYQRVFHR